MQKFHPILFSTEMVKAIQEGRKTMTRRIIKGLPGNVNNIWFDRAEWIVENDKGQCWDKKLKCPYGKVGDVLWVRETTTLESITDKAPFHTIYKADVGENYPMGSSNWTPSIFMPKAACRIFLEITDIRVERLRDISEEDAKAEGVYVAECCHAYYHGFSLLWQKINGAESWDANPWVWAISFKRITKPENFNHN